MIWGLSSNRGLTIWVWKIITRWHWRFFSTEIFGQSQLLDAKTEDFSNLKWRCTWWANLIWFVVSWMISSQSSHTFRQEGSILLTSGYWGLARHFNYIGDLTMCIGWLGYVYQSDSPGWWLHIQWPFRVPKLEVTTCNYQIKGLFLRENPQKMRWFSTIQSLHGVLNFPEPHWVNWLLLRWAVACYNPASPFPWLPISYCCLVASWVCCIGCL